MLVRKTNGNEFHIVAEEFETYWMCLCGKKVERNCVRKQSVPNGMYSRCVMCRKIQNERILKSRMRPNISVRGVRDTEMREKIRTKFVVPLNGKK